MSRKWIRAAGIRAAKTFCQCIVGMIPAAVTITEVEWTTVLSTAALAAVLSILTSIAGLPEVDE